MINNHQRWVFGFFLGMCSEYLHLKGFLIYPFIIVIISLFILFVDLFLFINKIFKTKKQTMNSQEIWDFIEDNQDADNANELMVEKFKITKEKADRLIFLWALNDRKRFDEQLN